jgi:cytochrome b561
MEEVVLSRMQKIASSRPAPATRYGKVAQAFHWITAVLVLVAFLYGPGGSEQRVYASAQDADRHLHESLGLLIFTLALLRLLWRAFDTRPDPPQVPRWMGWAAKAVQVVLYILLLALPLTAISGAWLEGHALTLLGGVTLASPLATAHAAGASLARIHGWLGDAILWIAGAHALAAIYHHWILRDGVFVSMLPGWIPLRQRQRE